MGKNDDHIFCSLKFRGFYNIDSLVVNGVGVTFILFI